MAVFGIELRDAIGKKWGMERAASKLSMSRATLYNKLNAREIDRAFLDDVKKILEIDVEKIRATSDDVPKEMPDDSNTKVYTIPIKNQRHVKITIPADTDREDVKTIIKHLNLWESSF